FPGAWNLLTPEFACRWVSTATVRLVTVARSSRVSGATFRFAGDDNSVRSSHRYALRRDRRSANKRRRKQKHPEYNCDPGFPGSSTQPIQHACSVSGISSWTVHDPSTPWWRITYASEYRTGA